MKNTMPDHTPDHANTSTDARFIDAIMERLRSQPVRSVPVLRSVRRELSRRILSASPDQVIQLALELIEREPDLRWFAYELVHHHRPTLRHLGQPALEALGRSLDSWHTVDPFAVYLSGPAWREGQISDDLVLSWAAAPDLWWRRVALVSTVALNNQARGGSGDPARTLLICRQLVADPTDMVVKALSWALRELVKHDATAVAEFVQEHHAVLAPRVRREVGNKLGTGVKNPRRAKG